MSDNEDYGTDYPWKPPSSPPRDRFHFGINMSKTVKWITRKNVFSATYIIFENHFNFWSKCNWIRFVPEVKNETVTFDWHVLWPGCMNIILNISLLFADPEKFFVRCIWWDVRHCSLLVFESQENGLIHWWVMFSYFDIALKTVITL